MATLKADADRRKGERGQAIVELALTLPLLLLVLLGIFDFGLMFQRFEVVANAAREAARVAVLPDSTVGQAQAHATLYLQSGGVNGATVNCAPDTLTLATAPAKTVDVMRCVVTYTHQHLFVGQIMSLFGGSLGSTQLRANSTMRKES